MSKSKPAAKSRDQIADEGAVVVTEAVQGVPSQSREELEAVIDAYREQNPEKAAAKEAEFKKKLAALK